MVIEVFQVLESIQGNRMMDPGIILHGPVFKTRYLANKWKKLNPSLSGYKYVEKIKIYESLEEANG